MTEYRIVKFDRRHPGEDFACGDDALNRYVIRYTWTNQNANAVTTHIVPEMTQQLAKLSLTCSTMSHGCPS